MNILKNDHYIFGLGMGILVPVVLFLAIYGINLLLLSTGIAKVFIDLQTHVFISLFGNLFPIRYYFVTLKFEKTGKGILIITFATVLLFFAFKEQIFHL